MNENDKLVRRFKRYMFFVGVFWAFSVVTLIFVGCSLFWSVEFLSRHFFGLFGSLIISTCAMILYNILSIKVELNLKEALK